MKRVGKLLFAGGLVTVVAMSGCRTGFDTDPLFTQEDTDAIGTGDSAGGTDTDAVGDEGGGDGVSVDGSTSDEGGDGGPGDAISVDVPLGDGGTPAFVCGNGVIEPAAPGAEPNSAESCDQGPDGAGNGDGCSNRCRIEKGWWCEGAPSVCYPICGDGIVIEGLEACDVGNQLGTQGCLADCSGEVEGWDCVYNEELERSVCFAAQCGDGIVAGDETCDPPEGTEQPECIGCQLQGCEDVDGDGAGIGEFCTFIDCEPFDPEVAPNLEEVCDGKDNNCNDVIDEGITVACEGECNAGFQYCVDGVLSECFGAATVGEEICGDGVDNDCDGFVDNDSISFPCGNAFCPIGEVQACGADSGAGCPTVEFNPEVCGNGEDDDCDGVVDDGCPASCVWVAPYTAGAPGDEPTGEPTNPFGSIQAAIDHASSLDGPPLNVCVACGDQGQGGYYSENITMAPGVSVLGGYGELGTPGACLPEINVGSGVGVYFPPEVGATPTFLRGFKVKTSGTSDPNGEPGATVLVEASGARIADNSIFVPGGNAHHIGIYVTPEANQDGAAPLITTTELYYGQSTISVGIRAESRVDIRDMCPSYAEDGKCGEACGFNTNNGGGIALNGSPQSASESNPGYVAGIVLVDAAGSSVDRVAVCSSGSESALGVVVQGNAEGVTITRSAIHAEGASSIAAGVTMNSCEGTHPRVAYNSSISAGLSPVMLGVTAGDGCHARIDYNDAIVGAYEAGVSNPDGTPGETVAVGVRCAPDKDSDNLNPEASGDNSLCLIAENSFIAGAWSGFADIAIGVACVRGCELVTGSTMIGSHDLATADVAGGLFIAGETPALVDRNYIYGACAAEVSVGVRASGAQARLTNNVIAGGGTALSGCNINNLAGEQSYVGVMVNPTINNLELDVHSNFISGLGPYLGNCQSAAVGYAALELDGSQLDVLPTTPLGLFRNNMLDAGLCLETASVRQWNEATLPRIFMNNTLLTSLVAWLTPTGVTLTEAFEINDAPFAYEGNTVNGQVTLELGELFGNPGTVASLGLQDTGTSDGAPPWDFAGSPRPQGEGYDRGPYEFDQSGAIPVVVEPNPDPDPAPGAP